MMYILVMMLALSGVAARGTIQEEQAFWDRCEDYLDASDFGRMLKKDDMPSCPGPGTYDSWFHFSAKIDKIPPRYGICVPSCVHR